MRFLGFSFGGWMGRRGIPAHCGLRMSSRWARNEFAAPSLFLPSWIFPDICSFSLLFFFLLVFYNEDFLILAVSHYLLFQSQTRLPWCNEFFTYTGNFHDKSYSGSMDDDEKLPHAWNLHYTTKTCNEKLPVQWILHDKKSGFMKNCKIREIVTTDSTCKSCCCQVYPSREQQFQLIVSSEWARCSPFVGFNRGDFLIRAFFLDFDPFLLIVVEDISCYMHFSSIGSKSGRRLFSNFEDISLSEEFSSKSAGQGPPGIRGRMPILWIILDHENFVEENCLLREISSTKK